MSKGEVQGTVKHRAVWIVLIAVFVLVIVLWLISVKMWFTPTFKVETKTCIFCLCCGISGEGFGREVCPRLLWEVRKK